MKLCVGVTDVAHLRQLQEARLRSDPPLRHRTRSFPRRSAELLAGGSIYWVIGGAMLVRQRLLDIAETRAPDAGRATLLVFDTKLVPVEARLVKPFQGWRYLEAAAAPRDVAPSRAAGAARLPEQLRRDLAALCLL
ncbi:MAG TPA: DUF1489 domain-containing protein [Acetobacteraceae bacterium]|jgi:hypothetical protein|nr:DUF1489 domain-containing protein [Acetobacteraceae bacterium]